MILQIASSIRDKHAQIAQFIQRTLNFLTHLRSDH